MTTMQPASSPGFQALPNDRQRKPFRDRPKSDERYVVFSDPEGFACFVHVDAIAQMAWYGQSVGERETIGRLGGRCCCDKQGSYLVVERATLNHKARGTAGSVVADIDAQWAALREFDRQCRALDCLGWWHSHLPPVGLYFSSEDKANQASWDTLDAIGIVIYPNLQDQALRVFRGPNSVELQLRRGAQHIRDLRERSLRTPADCMLSRSPINEDAKVSRPESHNRRHAPRMAAVSLGLAVAALSLSLTTLIFSRVYAWKNDERWDRVSSFRSPVADNQTQQDTTDPQDDSSTGLDNSTFELHQGSTNIPNTQHAVPGPVPIEPQVLPRPK